MLSREKLDSAYQAREEPGASGDGSQGRAARQKAPRTVRRMTKGSSAGGQ